MGWWSPTIMGGDPPMDAECEILMFLGVEDDLEAADLGWDDADAHGMLAAAFETKTVQDWIDFLDSIDESDQGITVQVLVLMIMQLGLPLDGELTDRVTKSCAAEDVSDWGTDAGERRARLDELVATAHSYDGTPKELPSEGLFQKIFADLGTTSTMH